MNYKIWPFITGISLSTPAIAELLYTENFNYEAGDLATRADSNWVTQGGNATDVLISSLIPVSPNNFLTVGGRAVQGTVNTRVNLNLSGIAGIATPAEGTSLYIAFVQQLDSNSTSPTRIFELWRGTATDNNTILSFGTDSNSASPDYGLTVEKGDANAVGIEASTTDDLDLANLIVIRVDYAAAGEPDTARVYINPTDGTEPATPVLTFDNATQNFDLTFNRIGFGSFQNSGQSIDEIRIATTFAEVIPTTRDSDMDGMTDAFEEQFDLDPMDPRDAEIDSDSDGLINLREFQNQTNPTVPDTDGDGLTDGEEVDGTMNPYREVAPGTVATTTPGEATDPNNPDSDMDGISDRDELTTDNVPFISNPNTPDTDGDFLPDLFEVTDNGSGTLDPTDGDGDNGPDGDPDGDGSFNDEESDRMTDPRNEDTDGDGLLDGVENSGGVYVDSTSTGTDPLNPDSDGDTLLDGQEALDEGEADSDPYNTDPNSPDTDGDGWSDDIEVLIAMTNGNDVDDFPSSFPRVATAVQLDFAGMRLNRGAYMPDPAEGPISTPAHANGDLGALDNVFNAIGDDTFGTIVDSQGNVQPGITVDLGVASDDGTGLTIDFDGTLSSAGLPSINGNSIYRNELWGDWLFLRNDENIVVRVDGFEAGDYIVNALVRELAEPARTYSAMIGTQASDGQTDPVFGETLVGIAGAPETFVANQNFFTSEINLQDEEAFVVIVDGTNAEFSSIVGLQIYPRAEVLAITNIAFTDAMTLAIDISADANTAYELFDSTDLDTFSDNAIGTVTTDDDGNAQFSVTADPASVTSRFFRYRAAATQ